MQREEEQGNALFSSFCLAASCIMLEALALVTFWLTADLAEKVSTPKMANKISNGYIFVFALLFCCLCFTVPLALLQTHFCLHHQVSLGITILLAFSVFQLVLADQSPKTSDFTPIMCEYSRMRTECIWFRRQLVCVGCHWLHRHTEGWLPCDGLLNVVDQWACLPMLKSKRICGNTSDSTTMVA